MSCCGACFGSIPPFFVCGNTYLEIEIDQLPKIHCDRGRGVRTCKIQVEWLIANLLRTMRRASCCAIPSLWTKNVIK